MTMNSHVGGYLTPGRMFSYAFNKAHGHANLGREAAVEHMLDYLMGFEDIGAAIHRALANGCGTESRACESVERQLCRQPSEIPKSLATCAIGYSRLRATATTSRRNSAGNALGITITLPARPSLTNRSQPYPGQTRPVIFRRRVWSRPFAARAGPHELPWRPQ